VSEDISILNRSYFHDDAAAYVCLEWNWWPFGYPVCPHCRALGRAGSLDGVRGEPSKMSPKGKIRHGLWKCYACRKQFTVTVKTIFEDLHLPMHKVLQGIFLLRCCNKIFSGRQLGQILEIDIQSAQLLIERVEGARRRRGAVRGAVRWIPSTQ
jgi:transposase-like protein